MLPGCPSKTKLPLICTSLVANIVSGVFATLRTYVIVTPEGMVTVV
jgi:hypothetical protein